MIQVDLRDNNQIINLNIDGKIPIRSRSSGLTFHNSMELLCCAVGSCVGNLILTECRYLNTSVNQIEDLCVTMDNFIIHINITYTKDANKELIENINRSIKNCPIASMLKDELIINNFVGIKLYKEIKKEPRGCCGG